MQTPCPCPPECAAGVTVEDTLKQVLADWRAKKLPANYLMLDSWWYQKDGDPPPSDPAHSNTSWPIRSQGGVIEWVPEPNVFPSQLAHGDPFDGLPTFLHNRAFSLNNTYLALPQFASGSLLCDGGNCVPVDEALFGHILDVMKPYKPFVYEQDWISKTYQNAFVSNDTSTGARWLDAMNGAAAARRMTIQFSMSYTPAIMHSSAMPAVTQIRGSGDYVCGGDGWKIADTSMLYWALGAVASKDTFWTTKHQPGCPKGGAYNCTEPNVELNLIVAALSWGPVGPGDRLGLTDVPLTMRSCDTTGRLLRPDRPHAPLDLAFEHLADGGKAAVQLWSSYTDRRAELPGEQMPVWHYLVGADVFPAGGIDVFPADLLVNASGGLGGGGCSFAAVPIVATGGAWPAMAVGQSVLGDIDDVTPLNLDPPRAPTPPPSPGPGPAPGPSFPCTSPSGSATEYCAHDGFYCDGGARTLAHQGGEALAACKALCDADANCNCVSHSGSPRHAGENCRAYHGASALTASGGGYDAFVKPDFSASSLRAREGAAEAAPVTAFGYWVLAPRLSSGFAIVGELAKAVPASRQRLCAMSSGAAAVAVTLCGGAAEVVELAYVAPGGEDLAAVTCTLGGDGRASVACSASTGLCSCG